LLRSASAAQLIGCSASRPARRGPAPSLPATPAGRRGGLRLAATHGYPALPADRSRDRADLRRVININVTGPTIAPAIKVQTNVANQVANSILSASVITQVIGR
jgi:hypothetical protein